MNRCFNFKAHSLLALFFILTGCTQVLNLTHEDPIEVNPHTRSMGAKLDDSNLETILTHNLNRAHPDMSSANVQIHSFNAVVLLTGQVPNESLRTLAADTVSDVSRVRQVYNELSVRANASFLAQTNDSYLKQKIRWRYLSVPELKDVDLEIIVEDSVAYLMGLTSAEQAEAAAHEASLVSGVRRVVKVFEYVE